MKIKKDAVVEKHASRLSGRECKRCSVDAWSSWRMRNAPTQLAAKGMRAEGVNSGREADDDGDGDEKEVAA